jgi:hypothetical protein
MPFQIYPFPLGTSFNFKKRTGSLIYSIFDLFSVVPSKSLLFLLARPSNSKKRTGSLIYIWYFSLVPSKVFHRVPFPISPLPLATSIYFKKAHRFANLYLIFLSGAEYRARIFKRLWSAGIDSKEWIPPTYVAWRAGTIALFLLGSYFLAPIDCLQNPAQYTTVCHFPISPVPLATSSLLLRAIRPHPSGPGKT